MQLPKSGWDDRTLTDQLFEDAVFEPERGQVS